MLYHLLYSLHTHPRLSWLNVVRYVSTRTLLAVLTALGIGLLLGPWFIERLRERQIGEQIRGDGPQTHKQKAGTPTMGGSLILLALVIPTLLWCDLRNRFVWITLGVTTAYGVIGFLDDYLKLTVSKRGLPGKVKIVAQLVVAAMAAGYIFFSDLLDPDLRFRLALPLVDFYEYPITIWAPAYFVLGVLVIVGTSNGVNLTDGLDGLAIGPVIISAGTFLILTYGAGTIIKGFNIAEYLKIPHIDGAGELAIFCGAMAGAGVGFLWYNTYPAQVFMGDVGSLSLGGALGTLALLTKNEATLLILGGIFVIETVSVMVQVASFKLTGKRVLLMAPIHHHFELKGWAEPKIIVRFWIISFMLALMALATLKVR
ncbi:MAG: phospho-N-acetylmuramoyl-pentapeptide-transferase [Myxococcales bacterium]|nr:phospho-N-acetylmuramoyl-pentapeptide-transferase [Myxococcota bacterium]MDW8280519.1 phospho-N-acetylmuramoyl-pentapeptide-transferase [Myxococcales bacterium]